MVAAVSFTMRIHQMLFMVLLCGGPGGLLTQPPRCQTAAAVLTPPIFTMAFMVTTGPAAIVCRVRSSRTPPEHDAPVHEGARADRGGPQVIGRCFGIARYTRDVAEQFWALILPPRLMEMLQHHIFGERVR